MLFVPLRDLHALAAVAAAWAKGVLRELNTRHIPALNALRDRI
eukprot:gene29859-28322_t